MIFVIIYVIQLIMTSLYCRHKKNKQCYNQTIDEKQMIRVRKAGKIKNKILNIIYGFIRLKLKILAYIPSHYIRKTILKNIYCMDIAEKVVIYGGCEIRDPWNISIGKGTIIGDKSILDGRNGLIIGENVNFGTGVWIWGKQHEVNDEYFCSKKENKIIINDRAWLSSRTTILPGITIGEGAVVAAGAVVTKNCDDFMVYGGVPAKKIGERIRTLKYEFTGEHIPFF